MAGRLSLGEFLALLAQPDKAYAVQKLANSLFPCGII